jgi:hypothetical protein
VCRIQDDYKFQVKGVPAKTVTMKEVAFAAYTNMAQNEPGLEATYYYHPPNMTYPNGAYVAVVSPQIFPEIRPSASAMAGGAARPPV